ncbi:MAG: hypothetical protein Q8K05_18470 [Polaromonas sp.]|uniref:hypothetical protein n=1 Tax=Polaromonas sp. TaxID=1869339 RepID=UPI0027319845|nr:hypothetical protein [Polaromonas sp.]MDP2258011.1 hypothetical protein [Polaromonas sp.]MDP3708875.1 hypothetical protein [Polaromonas sp.]
MKWALGKKNTGKNAPVLTDGRNAGRTKNQGITTSKNKYPLTPTNTAISRYRLNSNIDLQKILAKDFVASKAIYGEAPPPLHALHGGC